MDHPLQNTLVAFNRDDFAQRFMETQHGVTDASGRGFMDYMAQYFGAPAHPEKLQEENTWHTHYQTPYAYVGKNVLLKQRVLGLITDTMSWLQQEPDGFPMEYAPYSTYSFSTLQFEEGMMDVIPEEAAGYVLRSGQKSSSGTLIRKGKAIILEHGFFLTPEGRTHYFRQLKQLANTVLLTASYDALEAMVTTRPDSVTYASKFGEFQKPYRELVADLFRNMGSFQKSADAPDLMVAKMKAMFSTRGVVPEMIVTPHGSEYFFRGVGEEKLSYEKAGPNGVALKAVDPTSVQTFKGMRLRYTRPFLLGAAGQVPLDLLIRRRVVGEYYKMFASPVEMYSAANPYKSAHRDIFIYDMQKDNWARITLRQAVEHLNIFTGEQLNNLILDNEPGWGANFPDDLFAKLNGEKARTFGEISEKFIPPNVLDFIRLEGPAGPREPKKPIGENLQATLDSNVSGVQVKTLNVPDELSSTLSSDNLAGQKRPADTDSYALNGYFEYPVTKSTAGAEALHQSNLKLMEKMAISADTQGRYEKFRNGSDVNVEGFVTKTNQILSTGDKDRIQNEFVAPLKLVVDQKARSTQQHAQTIVALTTPTSEPVSGETGASITETKRTNTGLYALSDVDALNGKSGVKFQYVDLKSGSETNAMAQSLVSLKPEKIGDGLNTFVDGYEKASLPITRTLLQISDFASVPITKNNLLALVDNDIYFPFNILIMRPMISLITNTLIIGKGGADTGKTLFRNPDMMLGDDDVVKAHRAFFTMDLKVVVLEPLNLHILDDRIIREYVGGYTSKPWTPQEIDQLAANDFEPPNDPDRPSWFPYLIPLTNTQIDDIIDVTGRFAGAGDKSEEMHFLTTTADKTYMAYVNRHRENLHPMTWTDKAYNRIVAQGTQKCWSHKDKAHTAMILGIKAPMGVNLYTGCRRVIEGLDAVFESQGYEKCEQYQYA